MSQTILVTGAAGYIGSHTTKELLEKGHRVIAVDNLSQGFKEALDEISRFGDLIFLEGDICDAQFLESIFNDYTVDVVMHFAALCDPDESVAKPLDYYQVNVIGTMTLLEAMKKAEVKKCIFSSTCAIYGETKTLPVTEEQLINPANPYAHSKFLAEELIRYYVNQGVDSIIFRYFNVCGASDDGIIGDSHKPSRLLVQNAVRGALSIEPFAYTCPMVDTPDGTPIRDYIDVRDLAAAHLAALDYLKTASGSELINLGTGVGHSVKEIVNRVEKILGVSLEKGQQKPRRGEFAASYADASKALRLLRWKSEKTLEDSIKALALWYKKRPNGYKH